MLDEVAELLDGCILGVELKIHGSKGIGLLIFVFAHQQEKLNKWGSTSWLSSFSWAESLGSVLAIGGNSTGSLFLQNIEIEIIEGFIRYHRTNRQGSNRGVIFASKNRDMYLGVTI